MSLKIATFVTFTSFLIFVTAYGQRVAGGIKDSAIDASTTEAANFAVASVNAKNSGEFKGPLVLVKVNSVKSQVVAGTMYIMNIEVADSDFASFDMEVKVWSRPWLKAKNDPNNPPMTLTEYKVLSPSS